MIISRISHEDLPELLALQYLAYRTEAKLHGNYEIQPLTQTLAEKEQEFRQSTILKAVEHGAIIGSVRGRPKKRTLFIGKLIVHPGYRRRGVASRLMRDLESMFPGYRCELFTALESPHNIRLYEQLGYTRFDEREDPAQPGIRFVWMQKQLP